MKSSFNIHDKIKIKAEGKKKFVNYLNKILFYFRCSEVDNPDINIKLGDFQNKNYDIFKKDSYKIVKWKVGMNFGNKIEIGFDGNFLSHQFLYLYFVASSIRYLSLNYNLVPLHASALFNGERGFVFSALRKTGKTTTMLNAIREGFVYLADDMCLVDNSKVYSFPLPIHLYSYNLKNRPELKKELNISKRFEFFVKSSIFKGTLGYANFPTGYMPYKEAKSTIPKEVPLGKIINLLKKEEKNIHEILIYTNLHEEMYKFMEYLSEYNEDLSYQYKDRLSKSYKNLNDKMINYVVGNRYSKKNYENIKKIIEKNS